MEMDKEIHSLSWYTGATCREMKYEMNGVLILAMILHDLGAISLKLLGGKLAPKLVYFVLKQELLNL